MMMMADKLLVDTNVLVYAPLEDSPFFHQSHSAIAYYSTGGFEIWIARQIIREYLVTKSRLMIEANKYDNEQLLIELTYLVDNYQVADETDQTTFILSELLSKYKIAGKQIHDANIVATCLQNNIFKTFFVAFEKLHYPIFFLFG